VERAHACRAIAPAAVEEPPQPLVANRRGVDRRDVERDPLQRLPSVRKARSAVQRQLSRSGRLGQHPGLAVHLEYIRVREVPGLAQNRPPLGNGELRRQRQAIDHAMPRAIIIGLREQVQAALVP